MKKVLISTIFLSIIILSCSSDDDAPTPPSAPSSASLVFPEEESECTAGQQVSNTESSITFRWNASQNTDSYELTVKSLSTGVSSNFKTASTSFAVTLNKGEGYSWFVTSSSNEVQQTAQGETWRFYNAGDGIESYAPFPANIIAPASGHKFSTGSVNLSWSGSDVDNDIIEYDIYLENENPPTAIIESDLSQESTTVTSLASNIYYWKVITKDEAGNTSESAVYEFEIE